MTSKEEEPTTNFAKQEEDHTEMVSLKFLKDVAMTLQASDGFVANTVAAAALNYVHCDAR